MIATARSSPWAVAFLLAFVALCSPLGAMSMETKRVLLLHSFGREFAPYAAIVAAFRTELAQGSIEPLFAGSRPDLVVTIGPPAAG